MPGKRYDCQFKLAAARLVLEGEAPVAQVSRELEIPLSTLRRWATAFEEHGEEAFPGNGNPRQNKDYEILKLRKRIEELEMENEILKKIRAFLKQGNLSDSGS
jgi:transposase